MPEPSILSRESKSESSIVEGLCESRLGLGLDEIVAHFSDSSTPALILDVYGRRITNQRVSDFISRMEESGLLVDVRVNPTFETPIDSPLFSRSTDWKPLNVADPLAEALRVKPLRVDRRPNSFLGQSEIVVSPDYIRGWLLAEAPEGVQIGPIDFPEIRNKRGLSKTAQTVAVVTCSVPERCHDGFVEFCKRFDEKFKVLILPNIVAEQRSFREMLDEAIPAMGEDREIDKGDIPKLQELLRTRLRWRTLRQRTAPQDLTDLNWFSTDAPEVILREDIYSIRIREGERRILVAVPDITRIPSDAADGADPFSTARLKPGAFFLGVVSPAWVQEFDWSRDELVPTGVPFRANVKNRSERAPGCPALHMDHEYQEFKRWLGCTSDYQVVSELMGEFGKAIGDFVVDQGLKFLVKHTPRARRKMASKLLNASGIEARASDFRSGAKIVELVRKARDAGNFAVLPFLVSYLTGDTILCSDDRDECGLKPQKGTREQINQLIVDAAVEGRKESIPTFVQQLFDCPGPSTDAGMALVSFESERNFARLLRTLIATLRKQGEIFGATVIHDTSEGALCRIEDVGQIGLVPGVSVAEGAKIAVTLGRFDRRNSKFKLEVAGEAPNSITQIYEAPIEFPRRD